MYINNTKISILLYNYRFYHNFTKLGIYKIKIDIKKILYSMNSMFLNIDTLKKIINKSEIQNKNEFIEQIKNLENIIEINKNERRKFFNVSNTLLKSEFNINDLNLIIQHLCNDIHKKEDVLHLLTDTNVRLKKSLNAFSNKLDSTISNKEKKITNSKSKLLYRKNYNS